MPRVVQHNEVVSEQLDRGESLTVPDGEYWKVIIVMTNNENQFADTVYWHYNDHRMRHRVSNASGDAGPTKVPMLLMPGDYIEAESNDASALLIYGEVVKREEGYEGLPNETLVENEPVNVVLEHNEEITVPEDEMWRVNVVIANERGSLDHSRWTWNDLEMRNRAEGSGEDPGLEFHHTYLPGGDTIRCESSDSTVILITGWEVSADV